MSKLIDVPLLKNKKFRAIIKICVLEVLNSNITST